MDDWFSSLLRVLFGSNNLYAFHHPSDLAAQQKKKKEVPTPTFESAQEEIAKNSGLSSMMSGGKSKGQSSRFKAFFLSLMY